MAEAAANPKRTRSPCLTKARHIVAFLVTMLIVMLVMVAVVAFHSSVSFRFSIIHGDMWSDAPWSSSTTARNSSATSPNLLWFTLRADNLSGRDDIHCANLTVPVMEMPSPDSIHAMEIGRSSRRLSSVPFSVKRKSSRTVTMAVPISNPAALSYIVDTYGRAGTFDAMVQVDAFVVSSRTSSSSSGRRHGHGGFVLTRCYCWPIRVGCASSESDDDVTCKTKKEMGVVPTISRMP